VGDIVVKVTLNYTCLISTIPYSIRQLPEGLHKWQLILDSWVCLFMGRLEKIKSKQTVRNVKRRGADVNGI